MVDLHGSSVNIENLCRIHSEQPTNKLKETVHCNIYSLGFNVGERVEIVAPVLSVQESLQLVLLVINVLFVIFRPFGGVFCVLPKF